MAAPDTHPKNRTSNKPQHKKLARLPSNARITKRPLHHPAIASPHSDAKNQKVVYISAKTPFLSAVKRAEKLLQLVDKRAVQAATAAAKNDSRKQRRRKDEDELLDIAERVERQKRKDGSGREQEAVVFKGTGKAVQKVLELGLWFSKRSDTYRVEMRTGSVAAIDDITVDDEVDDGTGEVLAGEAGAQEDERGGVDVGMTEAEVEPDGTAADSASADTCTKTKHTTVESIPEARIRYTSVLEVIVRLK